MDPAYHQKPSDDVAPAADADPEPEPEAELGADTELPTMGDLDRVAADLDQIDAKLAALDDQR